MWDGAEITEVTDKIWIRNLQNDDQICKEEQGKKITEIPERKFQEYFKKTMNKIITVCTTRLCSFFTVHNFNCNSVIDTLTTKRSNFLQ